MNLFVAFGRLTLGCSASEAHAVINSGERMKANADLIIEVQTAKNFPVLPSVKCSTNAPGVFQ